MIQNKSEFINDEEKYTKIMCLRSDGKTYSEIEKITGLYSSLISYLIRFGPVLGRVIQNEQQTKRYKPIILENGCNFGPEVCRGCGKTHTILNPNKHERICPVCNKHFLIAKRYSNVYCSRECFYKSPVVCLKRSISSKKLTNLERLHNLKSKSPSKPELILRYIYEHIYPDKVVLYNYKMGIFWVDVFIPELMLGVEYDAPYWHQDKEKDLKRHRELETMGLTLIHYTSIKELKNLVDINIWKNIVKKAEKQHTLNKGSKYDNVLDCFISGETNISRLSFFEGEEINRNNVKRIAKSLIYRTKVRKLPLIVYMCNYQLFLEKRNDIDVEGRRNLGVPLLGVTKYHYGRWCANTKKDGRNICVGMFIDRKFALQRVIEVENGVWDGPSIHEMYVKSKTSKYVGVSGHASGQYSKGRWVARISLNGKVTRLGSFTTEEDAARAYDIEAIKLNRKTNFNEMDKPQHL